MSAELFRGRDRFTDRFQPGTATVTFKNTDGWADLVGSPVGGGDADDAAGPSDPGRRGRAVGWRGRRGCAGCGGVGSTRCTPQYHPVEHDVVVVNCVDALGEAGSRTGAGDVLPRCQRRRRRPASAASWTPSNGSRSNARSTSRFTAVQGTSLGALGIDLMGQAADSAGGVVHGDLDGDVVFRGMNWMLYDPDDPPDGIIGNVDPGFPGIPVRPRLPGPRPRLRVLAGPATDHRARRPSRCAPTRRRRHPDRAGRRLRTVRAGRAAHVPVRWPGVGHGRRTTAGAPLSASTPTIWIRRPGPLR